MKPVVWAALSAMLLTGCSAKSPRANGKRLIVLGVDAMDPKFVETHWESLPNLRRLREGGSFTRLATTSPPQSPVAWSTFITGTDPEQHGIFDFVQRDPSTRQILSSLGETVESAHRLNIGPYSLPLGKAHVEIFRHGRAFWELLEEHGIPATVIHMPTNYPPVESGAALAGMGTPDLEGTYGTFTYFTDDPLATAGAVAGGRVVYVQPAGHRVVLPIEGPANTLRRDRHLVRADLTADIDPDTHAMRGRIGGLQFILKEGEWSPWMHVHFSLIRGVASTNGMFRLYARQLYPSIQIYCSPLNIDPSDPALAVSQPADYAPDLAARIGRFYTLGIPEDTSALRQGALALDEFVSQTKLTEADDLRVLDDSLARFRDGLLFFYLSEIDQDSHVMWGQHDDLLLETYQWVDGVIGRVLARAPDAALIIMSDHGFAKFERAVNLNTWLVQEGFQERNGGEVDWPKTRAYAVGLNALYVNLAGREKGGIVQQGAERDALMADLTRRLRELRDPANGAVVVENVYQVGRSSSRFAPDLIVGYAPGYRASWETALGSAPPGIVQLNNDAWIADHCIDADAVPGVLLSNRATRAATPRLKDVTVTILKYFGVAPDAAMSGSPVY